MERSQESSSLSIRGSFSWRARSVTEPCSRPRALIVSATRRLALLSRVARPNSTTMQVVMTFEFSGARFPTPERFSTCSSRVESNLGKVQPLASILSSLRALLASAPRLVSDMACLRDIKNFNKCIRGPLHKEVRRIRARAHQA